MSTIFTNALKAFAVWVMLFGTATVSYSAYAAETSQHRGTTQQVHKINIFGRAKAPTGLQVFCLLNGAQCRGGGSSQVKMSNDLMKVLKRVNSKVNRTIRPRSDKGDIWSINVQYGDCEDYVLTKRSQLIKLGVPASALRIATAYTRSGEGHAVLVILSDAGDYVLDNRRNSIREWHKAGLKWVAISKANPTKWANIKG
jgi:predicted transglutaminase-like cysteine proteinase